jgi:hypothetical protein
MLGVTFQEDVIVGMAFQQAIITELAFRSCFQLWFSTGHDCRYSLLVGYDIRAGLTADNYFGAGLKKML